MRLYVILQNVDSLYEPRCEFQFGPAISASSIQYVHHVLVYFCFEDVTDTHVGTSSECSTNSLFYRCRGNKLLAGWAVGGEVIARLC